MTLHRLPCALLPLWLTVLSAQQSPQATAVATVDASAEHRLANTLQDGTPMKLRLVHKLDSHTAKNGDAIQFDVVNDVVIGGVTVLHRGAPATGVVTQAASSKTLGRAGRLTFTINDITLRNGGKVPVRAFNRTSGENRTGDMVLLMLEMPIVSVPFFLLIHGTNTTFPRGTEITAFVNGDLRMDLASFDTYPPANSGK